MESKLSRVNISIEVLTNGYLVSAEGYGERHTLPRRSSYAADLGSVLSTAGSLIEQAEANAVEYQDSLVGSTRF